MARPAAFTGLGFDAAIERSRANASILIVDAMATWCGPCRQMDATTWASSTVIERLMGTGPSASFAIQVDVDEEEEIAARLEVRAMPTLIAFASGVEHDRRVGGCGPAELLEWLDIVERGERYEDAQRAKRVAREALRSRAAGHLAAARHDDARADYAQLWAERRELDLVDQMRALATAHAPSRAAFAALRDVPAAGAPLEDVLAWFALNRVVDDEDATLAWYAANAVELPATRAVALLVEATIVPLMMRRGRWVEAGAALADPRAALLRLVEARPPDLRGDLANIVRALYAAGRDERASDFEFEAEAVDSSPEMTAALAAAKTHGRADRATRSQ